MRLADGVGVRPAGAGGVVDALERIIDATHGELRRRGAARARGSEGALMAAATLRDVARRIHAREAALRPRCGQWRPFGEPIPCSEPFGHVGVHRAGGAWWRVETCVHCGTPHDFAGELCRDCGKRPFVEVLDEDDGGHDRGRGTSTLRPRPDW